ncbi:uncharacterized protein SAMN02745664_11053 [Moraxella cuniculi DSM 21768]|uniref:Uncharacterized protein n=2 Tax=Moraxella cuniculi TaxID=34061 RepID=A0A1N7F716_9GAMM|nr:hypothetical protein [Moraxella cuniculi]OOS06422.1 hypothetical protein B0189_04915 [Moraxella cuniculi]SIR96110.1 uncharacterized protein SAMN02745664_11053 [Moraxella cuniculi DSM 21768]VEG12173.1 Uncharacterised protein [Moraxella cuniculi]
MVAFVLNLVIIAVLMWWFFKFMYPKPPKEFFPKEGDDTSIRQCHQCQHRLASYRGILLNQHTTQERFFCNQEHLAAYAKAHPDENLPTDVN